MTRPARRFAEWAVYGFLAWFESFDSVWQTTLVIFAAWGLQIAFPHVDPGHLVFLLVLSLYATFTQNGIGHGNKLTAQKVDQALAELRASTQTIVQLALNEQHMQEALAAQTDAMAAALEELRAHLAKPDARRR